LRSPCGRELHVVDCADEEEVQAEMEGAVSVTVGDDLERLSMAMTFSQGTRSLEMARFLGFSLAENGVFLLRFFDMRGEEMLAFFQLGIYLPGAPPPVEVTVPVGPMDFHFRCLFVKESAKLLNLNV
jgi:hypothetical protein